MKGNLVYMLLLLMVQQGSCNPIQARNEPPCAPGDNFFSVGPECFNFYSCRDGSLTLNECPGSSLWNDLTSRCDDAENVICAGTEPPITDAPAPTSSPTTPEPTTVPPSMTFLPETEGALPILFPDSECPPDIRAFQVHATNCRLFYYCLYGIRYPQTCPFLQSFNFLVGHCVDEEDRFCFPNSQ
uniref:Chitin-binding type-2 domain-containing protein n=1 Tax=Anopheles atroparvus TaxID=41427 RepID=A0AAG5DRE1_ANOAO